MAKGSGMIHPNMATMLGARWAHRALWHASLWHMHENKVNQLSTFVVPLTPPRTSLRSGSRIALLDVKYDPHENNDDFNDERAMLLANRLEFLSSKEPKTSIFLHHFLIRGAIIRGYNKVFSNKVYQSLQNIKAWNSSQQCCQMHPIKLSKSR
ncbi:hypothetical protein JHK86_055033 [Glycine max]|nr:hypothetical protein JHK86_055033 [Glycine max]